MSKIHVELLEGARRRIEAGKGIYICIALDKVFSEIATKIYGEERADYYDALTEIVIFITDQLFDREDPLCPHTYGTWIAANYPKLVEGFKEDPDRHPKARSGRLAWIDHLIKEFSK